MSAALRRRVTSSVVRGAAARQAVLASVQHSLRAVSASLGPHGRVVLHTVGTERTGVATDGLTIAQEIADAEGAGSVGQRVLKETLFDARRAHPDGTARLASIMAATLERGTVLASAGFATGALADQLSGLGDRIAAMLQEEVCSLPDYVGLATAACFDPALAGAAATLCAQVGTEGVVEVRPSPRAGELRSELRVGFSVDADLEHAPIGLNRGFPDAAGI